MTVNTFYQCLPIKHSVNMSYYTHFARNKLIKLSAILSFLGLIFYFYNHQAKSYYLLKHSKVFELTYFQWQRHLNNEATNFMISLHYIESITTLLN